MASCSGWVESLPGSPPTQFWVKSLGVRSAAFGERGGVLDRAGREVWSDREREREEETDHLNNTNRGKKRRLIVKN